MLKTFRDIFNIRVRVCTSHIFCTNSLSHTMCMLFNYCTAQFDLYVAHA